MNSFKPLPQFTLKHATQLKNLVIKELSTLVTEQTPNSELREFRKKQLIELLTALVDLEAFLE